MKLLIMAILAGFTLMPVLADEPKDKQVESVKATVAIEVPAVEKLSDIKKIFIAPLGTGEGAELIRQKIITQLMKSNPLVVVESPDQADATLNGVAELNGHLVLYRGCGRTRYSPELLVRLIGRNKQMLWTDDVIISKFFASGNASKVSSDVADKLVKNLTEAIELDNSK